MNLSIVIICKNGAPGISETLLSIKGIGNEILVYDSGSCDDSVQIAKDFGASVVTGTWEGYGRNRYKAAQLAANDWILMLDTDEVINKELKESILTIDLQKENFVYNIRYKNFYGKKYIRHGEWGNDSHIRMANRKAVYSDQETVHEKLFLQHGLIIQTLPGFILHYTAHNSVEYAYKMVEYARLSAEKYYRQGRHSSFIKIFFSPLISFLQNYFFKLGFLDGWEGFCCARMSAWYTFLKYAQLRDLKQTRKMGKVFNVLPKNTSNEKMKGAITIILTSIMFCLGGIAQTRINSIEQAEQLLRKGKTQEVAGIIVSSVGFVGSILGLITLSKPEQDVMDYAKALGLGTAGIVTSIVGIVYLTSGNKKIKKANLFLNSEHLGITPEFKSRERIVSVGVKLNF